jgi:hypothetical protein
VRDGNVLRILEENSPEAEERFRKDMEHLATKSTDWSANLNFYRYAYHRVSADVGWLREAYLVAFAAFGYRHILDPALESVRRQLARPREELISAFKIEDPTRPADVRLLMLVSEADWLRSVAV